MTKLAIVASLLLATPVFACPNVDHGPGHDNNAPKTADKKTDSPKTDDKAKEQPKQPDQKPAADTAKKEQPAPKKKA